MGAVKGQVLCPEGRPESPVQRAGADRHSRRFRTADLEEQERSRCARRDRDQESRGDGRASQRASNSELPLLLRTFALVPSARVPVPLF